MPDVSNPKLSEIRVEAVDREGSMLSRDREYVAMAAAIEAVIALESAFALMGAPPPTHHEIRNVIRQHIDVEG